MEGLRQLRVHQYLEDQLENVIVEEELLTSCGWQESKENDAQEASGFGSSAEEDEFDLLENRCRGGAEFFYRNIDWTN